MHPFRVFHKERNTIMKKSKLILAAVLAAATALTGCSANTASESSTSESVNSSAVSTAESAPAEENSDNSAASDVSTVQAATAESAATAEADDEDYNTGDASLDNPRNQDGIGENELLVLSFGTSFNDSRLTIGAIENDLEATFPEYSVRRGFTANIVIDHVKRRDGEKIDDIGESLDRAVANGVKRLVTAHSPDERS